VRNKELKEEIMEIRRSLNSREESDEKININLNLKIMGKDLDKAYIRVDKIKERVEELRERAKKLRKRQRK